MYCFIGLPVNSKPLARQGFVGGEEKIRGVKRRAMDIFFFFMGKVGMILSKSGCGRRSLGVSDLSPMLLHL